MCQEFWGDDQFKVLAILLNTVLKYLSLYVMAFFMWLIEVGQFTLLFLAVLISKCLPSKLTLAMLSVGLN